MTIENSTRMKSSLNLRGKQSWYRDLPPSKTWLVIIFYSDISYYIAPLIFLLFIIARKCPICSNILLQISLKWVSMLGAISLCYPIVVLHLSRWMSYELKVVCFPHNQLHATVLFLGYTNILVLSTYTCDDSNWMDSIVLL